MALKKLCRCGNMIGYSDKYCEECDKKAKEDKTESNRYYDREIRNKDSAAVYHSMQWDRLTTQCKERYKGLDIYSYYINRSIEYGSICHHIVELTDNKARAYDIGNLIYLSNANHSLIHSLYKKDYEGTKKILFDLVDRWNKEYN